ncbi:MAG: hypothetical protein NZ922_04955 [Candidatus Methanomethyliaceae archaeon]|nr:hypothetical protein [Candidatus Methanomethyliaceae archaeon]MDW7970714.1 hypothetical protein [Nitrososphaerota archaeon]
MLTSNSRAIAISLKDKLPIIIGDTYFLHYTLFPMLTDSNEDFMLEKVRGFFREYMDSEDYRIMHSYTAYDDIMSSIYTTKFIEELLKKLEDELTQRGQQMQSGSEQGWKSQSIIGLEQKFQEIIQESLVRSMAHAKNKTKEFMEKFNDVRELVDVGKKPGTFRNIIDLTEKIMKIYDAERILSFTKKTTKSIPLFTKIKKRREKHGDELFGYKLTRDVKEAISREIALPEELFYYKLASTGFMAKEKIVSGEGAYYVAIDKSGSMIGEKTIWARSVALSLFKLAKRKKRKFFLRFFDAEVHPEKPISNPFDALELILKVGSEGGTNINKTIRTAIKDLHELRDKTNTIIIITDGKDDVNIKAEELKENNASLIAVMIKGENESLRKLAEGSKGQYLKAELTEEGALKLINLLRR